jgi:hypothetical protein
MATAPDTLSLTAAYTINAFDNNETSFCWTQQHRCSSSANQYTQQIVNQIRGEGEYNNQLHHTMPSTSLIEVVR